MISLTFFGPYVTTTDANGYFGTWLSYAASISMLATSSEMFRKSIDKLSTGVSRKPVLFLFIASAIEIGASINTCVPQSNCNGLYAFAVALGSVSAILALILIPLLSRLQPKHIRMFAIFFCLWWVIGGMIVTFDKPFRSLGNGYFSVLAAIIASFYLLRGAT
jgi:hypothetical protein